MYPPKDVGFYTHPSELVPEQLDPLIRDVCLRINESGWVWTAESCQGHPDATEEPWANNTDPMLRLVCKFEDLGTMMSLLMEASKLPWNPDSPWDKFIGFRIYPHSITEWCVILVYAAGLTVYHRDRSLGAFERFAEMVSFHSNKVNIMKPKV